MDEKEELIVKYGRIYEQKLKNMNYSNIEVERYLNIWIKKALEYCKNNSTISKKEFEEILFNDNIILK